MPTAVEASWWVPASTLLTPEIAELAPSVGGEKGVLRLEVAVEHLAIVDVLQPEKYLGNQSTIVVSGGAPLCALTRWYRSPPAQ